MSFVPNLITLGRLILVPVIIYLIGNQAFEAAFWVFVAAGISDGVDGFIAKRFGYTTALGAYLDPVADKALLVSIFVSLGLQDLIPNWLVILVVSRDVLIVGAVLISWLIGFVVTMRPLMVSKINTTAQIAYAAAVLAVLGFQFESTFGAALVLAAYLTGLTTVISGASYLVDWVRDVSAWETDTTTTTEPQDRKETPSDHR
ncbi:CDP-alcohol phosphatidyltransferase family protein [Candidatus Phaeomarinobacter ectocarpi]|uniref:CDP-alcohol phosphatidyltransferase family protein n=1 Tax=Candidatus Phaeomarinibacter ectocarpi TaxID=1458461 RepID=UPI0009DFFAAC|nr:CDP-alcohol phosphatidyltransferase family protein [Candidatus Phaeomarinobacter ectocarpi]